MKIRSITDVITNSSSETFIINLKDPLYSEIKKEAEFKEFPDFDSLRDFILSDHYYGWNSMYGDAFEINNPNYDSPRYDVFECEYDEPKRTLENWEKYKELYKGLLGIGVLNLDRDSDECRKIHEILYKDNLKKNILPLVKDLIPGKRYYGNLRMDDQEVSFEWTGEDKVIVEGPKFKPFEVNIVTLLELVKKDTLHTDEV